MIKTKQDWIDAAKAQRKLLTKFINQWHPGSMENMVDTRPPLPITAPGAERARQNVMDYIRERTKDDPAKTFNAAIDAGDIKSAFLELIRAWFGVPESTGCWDIPGFRECVELLGEVPDNDEDDGTVPPHDMEESDG